MFANSAVLNAIVSFLAVGISASPLGPVFLEAGTELGDSALPVRPVLLEARTELGGSALPELLTPRNDLGGLDMDSRCKIAMGVSWHAVYGQGYDSWKCCLDGNTNCVGVDMGYACRCQYNDPRAYAEHTNDAYYSWVCRN